MSDYEWFCVLPEHRQISAATGCLYNKSQLSKFKKPQLIQMFMDRQEEAKGKFIEERSKLMTPVSAFEYELMRQKWEDEEYKYKDLIEENKRLKREIEKLKK